jgi:hypothetical protein
VDASFASFDLLALIGTGCGDDQSDKATAASFAAPEAFAGVVLNADDRPDASHARSSPNRKYPQKATEKRANAKKGTRTTGSGTSARE